MNIHPLLLPYVPLVEYLGQVFGKNCEVVLYDTTSQPTSVIAIANNHISEQTVGDTIPDSLLRTFCDPRYQKHDTLINFPCFTLNGSRSLRSSAYRIRDNEGIGIGAFCINYDITDWLVAQKIIANFTAITAPQDITKSTQSPPQHQEFFSASVEETLHHGIDQLLQEYHVSPDRLTQSEKQEIVSQMYNKGLFTFKGSVSLLANRMNVSEQTIYRYLRKCQNPNI